MTWSLTERETLQMIGGELHEIRKAVDRLTTVLLLPESERQPYLERPDPLYALDELAEMDP
jgi:hypothetical protein